MPQRPNIVWLITDEQRRDSLGCYGSPWAATPCLDRLAAEACDATLPHLPDAPLERRNLADAPEAAPTRQRMEGILREHLDASPPPQPTEAPTA